MSTTIAYDNAGRVTGTTISTSSKTLGKLVYTLDAASQITTETSTSLGATRTFTNDTAGRVTKENTTAYAYDAAGELTTNGATTQGYDAASQLTTGVVGSASTAYTFDARGDRTKATTGTTVATYGYDQVNRLTSFARGTTTASYTYNGDGLRASKTVGSTTTKFVYDTAQGLPLVLSDGASYYLYGPGGVPFEQVTTAGTVTYLHADQLGSIRMITGSTGKSVGTATYTAYGTRTTTGTTSAFGYAGQYTDTETGLQWLRARYYDPTTGQFLTVDPLTAATGARYAYAGGNPITGADPSGLCRMNPFSGSFWTSGNCLSDPVQAVVDHARAPDYVNLNVGLVYPLWGVAGVGLGGNFTFTRDGHFYAGPEVEAGVAGLTGTLEAGWINQCTKPTSDQLDSFVGGFGATGSGFVPVLGVFGPAGGEAWGNEGGTNASDFSTTIGVGAGAGRSLTVNQGYNWGTGIETPRW